MISCLAVHRSIWKTQEKIMSQKFCNWCPQFASRRGQSEQGGGGGSSSSSSVQILIDNETGHKKEIEERKKASKSATILYCTTQESH